GGNVTNAIASTNSATLTTVGGNMITTSNGVVAQVNTVGGNVTNAIAATNAATLATTLGYFQNNSNRLNNAITNGETAGVTLGGNLTVNGWQIFPILPQFNLIPGYVLAVANGTNENVGTLWMNGNMSINGSVPFYGPEFCASTQFLVGSNTVYASSTNLIGMIWAGQGWTYLQTVVGVWANMDDSRYAIWSGGGNLLWTSNGVTIAIIPSPNLQTNYWPPTGPGYAGASPMTSWGGTNGVAGWVQQGSAHLTGNLAVGGTISSTNLTAQLNNSPVGGVVQGAETNAAFSAAGIAAIQGAAGAVTAFANVAGGLTNYGLSHIWYVDLNGNNGTGVEGDISHPFLDPGFVASNTLSGDLVALGNGVVPDLSTNLHRLAGSVIGRGQSTMLVGQPTYSNSPQSEVMMVTNNASFQDFFATNVSLGTLQAGGPNNVTFNDVVQMAYFDGYVGAVGANWTINNSIFSSPYDCFNVWFTAGSSATFNNSWLISSPFDPRNQHGTAGSILPLAWHQPDVPNSNAEGPLLETSNVVITMNGGGIVCIGTNAASNGAGVCINAAGNGTHTAGDSIYLNGTVLILGDVTGTNSQTWIVPALTNVVWGNWFQYDWNSGKTTYHYIPWIGGPQFCTDTTGNFFFPGTNFGSFAGNAGGLMNFAGFVETTNNTLTWTFFPTTAKAYTNSLPPGSRVYWDKLYLVTVTNSPETGYTTNSGLLDACAVLNGGCAAQNSGGLCVSTFFDRGTNVIVMCSQNPQSAGQTYMLTPGSGPVQMTFTNWAFQEEVRVQP
ncbi:MAG: hypothetical protein ABSE16_08410, partial [Verrucomicrobiota bacterium]